MLQLILRWIGSALALIITVYVGHAVGVHLAIVGSHVVATALIAALVIGLVNAVVRPIVDLLAMPITCLTLGLFSFVVNALLFWITSRIVPDFIVRDFWAALFGSVVMSLVAGPLNWLLVSVVKKRD